MKVATTLLLLGCLLGSALAHRTLLAPSPTQLLNAQRKEQVQQAGQVPKPASNFLQPPCFVASSFWPLETCEVTMDASKCARIGANPFPTYGSCCAPQVRGRGGAFVKGCTDINSEVTCFYANGFFPRTCGSTTSRDICLRGWGVYKTENECCAPGNAHGQGCGGEGPVVSSDDNSSPSSEF